MSDDLDAPDERGQPCSKCGIHLEPDDDSCWLHDCPLRAGARPMGDGQRNEDATVDSSDRYCEFCECVVADTHRCDHPSADRLAHGYKPHRFGNYDPMGRCFHDLWPNGSIDNPCGEPADSRIHTTLSASSEQDDQ